MKRGTGTAGVLALSAASLGWWSCSSDERADGGPDGGTDAGGLAGAGGAGFGGTAAAGGGKTGGGAGGTGGADGGVDWGAAPKWEATSAVAVNCPIERLANASEVRVFAWLPCEWSPADCQQAVFNPKLVGSDSRFGPTSTVHDDGNTVRVGLQFEFSANVVLYADETGNGLDGIRGTGPTETCHFWSASLWGNRFGVNVAPYGGPNKKQGGVVGQIGSSSSPIGFTLSQQPPGGSQRYVLGADRWVWWWAPLYAYTSVSAIDGSSYQHFVNTAYPSSIVFVGEPVTTGKLFLFKAYEGDDAGAIQGKLMWSDGIAAPQVYLEPSDPKDDYGTPAYADTHLAFMRGVNRKDVNVYDSTELWVTPYFEDPTKLTPQLVTQLPYASMGDAVGGWGRVATTAPDPSGLQFVVRNLATKAEGMHFLPKDHAYRTFLGLSRKHLWVAAADPNSGPSAFLVRYALK